MRQQRTSDTAGSSACNPDCTTRSDAAGQVVRCTHGGDPLRGHRCQSAAAAQLLRGTVRMALRHAVSGRERGLRPGQLWVRRPDHHHGRLRDPRRHRRRAQPRKPHPSSMSPFPTSRPRCAEPRSWVAPDCWGRSRRRTGSSSASSPTPKPASSPSRTSANPMGDSSVAHSRHKITWPGMAPQVTHHAAVSTPARSRS
jgi:hypothetical protein